MPRTIISSQKLLMSVARSDFGGPLAGHPPPVGHCSLLKGLGERLFIVLDAFGSTLKMADWRSPDVIRMATDKYRKKLQKTNYGAATVSQLQKATTVIIPPQPPTWLSKFDIDGSREEDAMQLICKTIRFYDQGHGPFHTPEIGRLEGHWVGYSAADVIVRLEKRLSERRRWRAMRGKTSSPVVTFFIYGGTFV